jgi:hypothetical protein
MSSFNRSMIVTMTLQMLIVTPLKAEDGGYHYPELMVVPKASQTLENMAKKERESSYATHLLLQTPALLTLASGLAVDSGQKENAQNAGTIATFVGGGWLAGTIGLTLFYRPYSTGLRELGSLPAKATPQSALMRERAAEEKLYYPAYIMRRIQYLSAFTNLAAAGAVAGSVKNNNTALTLGALAAATSLLPLIFDHPWIAAYDQHEDYKKKIYGPISGVTLLPEPSGTAWSYALNMSLRF